MDLREGLDLKAEGTVAIYRNFQVRRLLRSFVKSGKIFEADAKRIEELFSNAGAKFPQIGIAERREVERSVERLLLSTERNRLESTVWGIRARFAKGHELAYTCLAIDMDVTNDDGLEAVKVIHAILLTLVEGTDSSFVTRREIPAEA